MKKTEGGEMEKKREGRKKGKGKRELRNREGKGRRGGG